MADVGRPTELDDALCLKIRAWVLEGKVLKDIATLSEIPFDTIEGWMTRNYHGFHDKYCLYKTEYRLKKAEEFGDRLMDLEETDRDILKLKQKEAEFVRETVGKQRYSKRNEQTGPEGGAVQIQIVNYDNTPTQVPTETVPATVLAGMGFGSEASSESSSPSEWEGFSSDGEPTKENA